ncbi:MAG: glycosyltransferase family 4 protein [Chloroflexi bacterium]|nr:glycosyltransferase family 4 protein [Chloroflexota bacterium]
MRILVVNWFDWTHPLWGGAEVYLREVYRRLAARGHDVTLLCSTYAGGAAEAVEDGIRVVRRGNFWTFHLQVPWFYRRDPALAGQAWDCVFEYTNKVPMLTPLFVRAPLIAVAHHLFGASIFHESKAPIAAYVYLMERLIPVVYRRTPWIAVSPSTRQDLVALGIPAGNIHVIPNGIDSGLFSPRRHRDTEKMETKVVSVSPCLRGEPPIIAWIGRMKRYKRVDVLLRAMPLVLERVPEARLELAGDGPEAPRLRALAGRLGLAAETVRFLGAVTEEEKLALLRRATVLAQPSLKEGWGRTVLEAAACGVPAVASDVPGLRDSVLPNETGLLVPPTKPDALAGAVLSLLLDPDRRRTLGQAARAYARRFTWDDAALATEHLARERASVSRPLVQAAVPGTQR